MKDNVKLYKYGVAILLLVGQPRQRGRNVSLTEVDI